MGDKDLQVFADRLKELRTKLNITQKEFADKIGITASALSAYETNTKNPSIAVAKRIAEDFNVSIDWLCGLSESERNGLKVETYADAIRMLVSIFDAVGLSAMFLQFGTFSDCTAIVFDNQEFNKFLAAWGKFRNLYLQGTIDREMYEMWIEKRLSEFDTPFDNALSDKNIRDLINELDDMCEGLTTIERAKKKD